MIGDLKSLRKESWSFVSSLGLESNIGLPFLDRTTTKVSVVRVGKRMLCMHAAAAAAFGFPRERAIARLAEIGLTDELTLAERQYLHGDMKYELICQLQLHSLFALAWSCKLITRFQLTEGVPEELDSKFPDIVARESPEAFLAQLSLRESKEVLPFLDQAYCLNWALRNAELMLHTSPYLRLLPIVRERRRGLEWIFVGGDWEDVPLDT